MNAVVIGVFTMLVLSMVRVNVVLSVFIGAITAGLVGGLSITETMSIFSEGLGGAANIALSYAILGAFTAALAHSGVPNWLAMNIVRRIDKQGKDATLKTGKYTLLLGILMMAIASQNIIPIHIAFIPVLIPPLLATLNKMQLDRRAVSCVLIFGLCATYLVIPFGFGDIYLNQILGSNLESNGVSLDNSLLPLVMSIPVSGMLVGMLLAVFISYKKPRKYHITEINVSETHKDTIAKKNIIVTSLAVTLALIIQIITSSILLGFALGFMILVISGIIHWRKADRIFADGMKIMAFAGFVMMAASGFGEVLRQTGDILQLTHIVTELFNGNKPLTALAILMTSLLISMGIGSSFSAIPIIAAVFVPIALQAGFSHMAIAALIGTAGALGDTGSPASESVIGPTMGLNTDGQHDHIMDTVTPALLHYNISMIIFGWIAAMIL